MLRNSLTAVGAARLNRRQFLKTVTLGTACATLRVPLVANESRADKPNIVYILADDLGCGDLDADGDVDMGDFALFQAGFTGPQ